MTNVGGRLMSVLLDRPATASQPGVSVSVETITPDAAKILMARNVVNRRLDEKVAARYARDMRAGRWLLTGESMAISREGSLIQGQHRCRACIIADTSFSTVVIRGVDTSSQLAMDSGKKRSLADQLRLLGEKDTSALGTTINFCWKYDRGLLPHSGTTPSRAEAIEWLQENGGIRDSILLGRRVSGKLPINRMVVASTHFLTSRVDASDADLFFEKLVLGSQLADGDPVLAYRRWIDRWVGKRDRPAPVIWAHALLKCMNYWRSGQSLQLVKVVTGEAFPRVWGESGG